MTARVSVYIPVGMEAYLWMQIIYPWMKTLACACGVLGVMINDRSTSGGNFFSFNTGILKNLCCVFIHLLHIFGE